MLLRTDADIARMASLIDKHRFYDRFGVWSPVIDPDKEITAAIVRGLGARSCFELGCFTGSVISLLADAGVSVLGTEVSHLAFAFAQPNIREAMIFGDLLALDIDRRFGVVLCMDVLEHISPLKLDHYIERLVSLIEEDGYLYLNAPMWGEDQIFGVFEEPYLEEWLTVGDEVHIGVIGRVMTKAGRFTATWCGRARSGGSENSETTGSSVILRLSRPSIGILPVFSSRRQDGAAYLCCAGQLIIDPLRQLRRPCTTRLQAALGIPPPAAADG